MSDFTLESVANMQVDEVLPPPMIPEGDYIALITPKYSSGESDKKGTPYVRHILRLQEAKEDVDMAEWDLIPAEDREMELTHWFTPKTNSRIRKFYEEHLGLEVVGKKYDQVWSEACGHEVRITVKHEIYGQNKDLVRAVITQTAPA